MGVTCSAYDIMLFGSDFTKTISIFVFTSTRMGRL